MNPSNLGKYLKLKIHPKNQNNLHNGETITIISPIKLIGYHNTNRVSVYNVCILYSNQTEYTHSFQSIHNNLIKYSSNFLDSGSFWFSSNGLENYENEFMTFEGSQSKTNFT